MSRPCADIANDPCYYRRPERQCGRPDGEKCLHLDRIAGKKVDVVQKEVKGMKYINGLDTDNLEATCPKDEKVAWEVKDGFEPVRVITVRRGGGVRIYGSEGGIMDMPMPHFHDGEKSPDERRDDVYGKYRILDAKTGEEKKGRYFVLKIDANDANERRAVCDALFEYAKRQAECGRIRYATSVLEYTTTIEPSDAQKGGDEKPTETAGLGKKVAEIVFYATDQTEAVFSGGQCLYQQDYTGKDASRSLSAKEWCKMNGYEFTRREV